MTTVVAVTYEHEGIADVTLATRRFGGDEDRPRADFGDGEGVPDGAASAAAVKGYGFVGDWEVGHNEGGMLRRSIPKALTVMDKFDFDEVPG